MMMVFSSGRKATSFLVLLAAFRLRAVVAGSAAAASSSSLSSSSSSSSYQPTPGVEERWVAEEEFHGASSTEAERRLDQKAKKKKKRGRDPQPSYPGHDDFGEHSWWEDDDDYDNESDDDRLLQSATPESLAKAKEDKYTPGGKKRHRLRVWKNGNVRKGSSASPSYDDSSATSPAVKESSSPDSSPLLSEYDEEHPMRTDEWELDVKISRLHQKDQGELFPECYIDRPGQQTQPPPKRRGGYRKRQVMQFATNGYVKILEDETNNNKMGKKHKKPRVGKWRIGHSGVAFDIPVQMNVKRRKGSNDEGKLPTVLHYHADIHLNKFGERPRMFRGVITRDRHSSFLPPNFLRPVIGTFSAEGVGQDTADTSYKERAISLSRQQVINDAKGRNGGDLQ